MGELNLRMVDYSDLPEDKKRKRLKDLGYNENEINEILDREFIRIEGYFQSKSTRSNFELTFIKEHG